MEVFVAGASGRVGHEVVDRLTARGDKVLAASRNSERISWPQGVTPVDFDLHWDASDMTERLKGCKAVMFVAGSRGKDLLQVDAFGAVKLMQAAKAIGARRFVMLSSFLAMEPERWKDEPSLAEIANYNIAKFFADEWLVNNSGLEWTIIQPGVLREEPASGKIDVNPPEGGENAIPDVAEVLVETLDRPNTIGKVIMMRGGSTPISDALAQL